MFSANQRLLLCTMIAIALFIPGCSPRLVEVNGRLTNKGQPFQLPKNVDEVHVIFVPEKDKEGKPYHAAFQRVGHFTIPAIPVGKYRVVVYLTTSKGKDLLAGQYELDVTKFIVDVDGQTEITIDLPDDLSKAK